jgi:hypothetical protein
VVTLNQTQATQSTSTWLIRYQVTEEVARQVGITVSDAQAQVALQAAYQLAKASAEQQSLANPSLDLILAASRIPPGTAAELGQVRGDLGRVPEDRQRRYHAYVGFGPDGGRQQAQRGRVPGGQVAEHHGQPAVRAAGLQPAAGRLGTQPGGPAARPGGLCVPDSDGARLLIVLATSPRVAPGLLSWPAWQALRSAAVVLAPAGHPQLPALEAAGIACQLAAEPSRGPDEVVVWLPEPGAGFGRRGGQSELGRDQEKGKGRSGRTGQGSRHRRRGTLRAGRSGNHAEHISVDR